MERNKIDTLFPFMTTHSTNKLAKTFITEAKTMIGLGEEEIRLGDVVNSLIENDQTKSFLSIAIWHYGEGVKKLRIAFGLLQQSKKLHLSEKYKAYVELREKECREKADYALTQKNELEFLFEKRKFGEILEDEQTQQTA